MAGLIIYPKRGFLNTSFMIKSPKEDGYKVIFKGETIAEGTVKAGTTISLPKLAVAGSYTIESSRTKERHQVCIEDAIRLGSSDLKRSYVFDNFPYVIFVMKDRIHFYDPATGTYVYTENYLSPNKIQAIDETTLLFSTEHSNGVSVSVFDANNLEISAGKEYSKLIAFSKDRSMLYAFKENPDTIVVVNTRDLSTIEEIALSANGERSYYTLDEEKRLMYIEGRTSIHCIDIDTGHKKVLKLENAIGITDSGYLIRYIAEGLYKFENLHPDSVARGSFRYEVSGIRHFEGHSINNNEWQNESIACIDDIVSQYKAESERKIAAGEKVDELKDLDLKEARTTVEFYPSNKGVYVVEKTRKRTVNSLRYFSDSKRVYGVMDNVTTKLTWVADNGYEISYKINRWGRNTYINDSLASFALSSKEYAVINNGEIIEKFDTQSAAEDKVVPKQRALAPTRTIINGEEISPYRIVAKSDSKLICKSGNSYEYYERDNSCQEWGTPKIVQLEEEKHVRAKISPDGNYVVYSKGGNQSALYNTKKQAEETVLKGDYVDFDESGTHLVLSKGGNKYTLYDIEEQTEEDILTGNFVDYDKSGNWLFMKDANGKPVRFRQLRIYDPITLKWKKATPERYNFVSPDGKLYAKTALKERYFNLATNEEIDEVKYETICSSVNKDSNKEYTDEKIEKIKEEREKIVAEYKDYFQSYAGKQKLAKSWIDNIQDPNKCDTFSKFLLTIKQYIVVGIVKTGKEIEIKLGHLLSFLNYISFSYDNKYIGIVGKPADKGYLKLSKIDFNESRNEIEWEKDICDTQIADWATWTCAFTKQGLFGTYDSHPNLYLIDSFTGEKVDNYSYLKEHFMIPNRSLLCFSPSGKYMALSNQGYDAISLGGCGHVPSNKVFIYDTSSKEQITFWNDHGATIAHRNVVNAGFSIDESKLMTVSRDGVIIVRNIQEALNKQVLHSLSKAS